MEIDTYTEMLSAEKASEESPVAQENVILCGETLDTIYTQRAKVNEIDYRLVSAVTEKLHKAATDKRGLILWLKPGVSRDIKPEPIHLSETIRYLRSDLEYHSTGYDTYELLDETIDRQYQQIMKWLSLPLSTVEEEEPDNLKSLDIHDSLNRLEKMFLTGPVDNNMDMSKPLEEKMKEIIATSTKIFEDIAIEKIRTPDCLGD